MLLDGILRSFARVRLEPRTRAVVADRLTYLAADKLRRIETARDGTARVPGDIVEFGVALGGSGIVLAKGVTRDRRFLGFDVFSMIPEPTSEKDDRKSKDRYETIKAGLSEGIGGDAYYGYRDDLFSDVTQAFARHGTPVDGERVRLFKGLFEETWPKAGVTRLSLAHIDCDWYDPVRFCLNAAAATLSVGGEIIVDDYHDYGGCRTAVDEFMDERADFRMEPGPNPILHRVG